MGEERATPSHTHARRGARSGQRERLLGAAGLPTLGGYGLRAPGRRAHSLPPMPEDPLPPSPFAPPAESRGAVTQLLLACGAGERDAYERLFPLVYEHLRMVAHAQLRREREGHTLSTTALVHEAYLKLVDPAKLGLKDRAHFFGVAARAMRQVLVDHARRVGAPRRGGDLVRVDLDAAQIAVEERADTLLALDEALSRLAGFAPRLAQVVELRFFGGLTEEEAAEALGVTSRTLRRDWVKARGWLHRELAATFVEPTPAPAHAP